MRKVSKTLIGVAAMTLLAVLTPTAALAAHSSVPDGAKLLHPDPDESGSVYPGTGIRPIYNSSGQKIGQYQLFVDFVATSVRPPRYTAYVSLEVQDTLLGNGRGVKLKLMTKTGTNTSNVLGIYKGGTAPNWNRFGSLTIATELPMWAFDVDHGEDWGSTSYQFTGKFDRYVNQWDTTRENYPFFNLYG